MKFGLSLIVVGLMLFALFAPGSAYAVVPAFSHTNLDVLPVDPGNDGPNRDPFEDYPDWIFYDDGDGQLYLNGPNDFWSKVTFTVNTPFQLQAIAVLPYNPRNNFDDPMAVRVYAEGRNHQLGDLLLDLEVESVNGLQGQEPWNYIDLEENQYIEFEEGANFTIMYQVPGGPANGNGYWNYIDGQNNASRSSYTTTNPPPANHGSWTAMPGDLLIRAGGEYLEDFFDLELVTLWNEEQTWLLTPGMESTFVVKVANLGNDVELFVINFQMQNADGENVWQHQVMWEEQGGIANDDTIDVVCDEAFEAPDELGSYSLTTFIEVEGDADDWNNQGFLEQIVFDPENAPDTWIGYVDDTYENLINYGTGTHMTAAFHHPGEAFESRLTMEEFRFWAESANGRQIDVDVAVAVLDLEARRLTTVWQGAVETTGEVEGEWIDVQVRYENEEGVSIGPGQAFMATFVMADSLNMPMDGTDPIAGTNFEMPWAMLQSYDDGGNYSFANIGDFPIQAKLIPSVAPPPGKSLKLVPEILEFGYELELNTEYTIEALLISEGAEAVNITQIRVSPGAANYVTVNPNRNITIESQDTVVVTVTFQTAQEIEIDHTILIQNDTDVINIYWTVRASTYPMAVREEIRPGIPEQIELSQNHPNPFNPITSIDFALTKTSDVSFDVFDMSGRLVQEVYHGSLPAGYHTVEIDASDLPAGVYLYRLVTDGFVGTKKMVLMK